MKTKILLPIVVLVIVSVTNLYSQVTIYQSNNFTGESITIKDSWNAMQKNPAWNDKINSVKVATGYKATIYEHEPGRGMSKVIYSDWVVDAAYTGKVSTVTVVPIPKIILYKSKNFTGESVAITEKWAQAGGTAWNDVVNSIKVPAGYKIIIYEHNATRGAKKELSSDWVADDFWTNKISNIDVIAIPN